MPGAIASTRQRRSKNVRFTNRIDESDSYLGQRATKLDSVLYFLVLLLSILAEGCDVSDEEIPFLSLISNYRAKALRP